MSYNDGAVLTFNNFENLDYFLDTYSEIQHVAVDENSLRIRCYFLVIKGVYKRAFVQIEEKDEDLFDFKPSIDSGVVLIDKNSN